MGKCWLPNHTTTAASDTLEEPFWSGSCPYRGRCQDSATPAIISTSNLGAPCLWHQNSIFAFCRGRKTKCLYDPACQQEGQKWGLHQTPAIVSFVCVPQAEPKLEWENARFTEPAVHQDSRTELLRVWASNSLYQNLLENLLKCRFPVPMPALWG